VLIIAAPPAFAHTVGVSRGEYRPTRSTLTADLVFSRPELAAAVPGLDANGNGSLSAVKLGGPRGQSADQLLRGLEVRSDTGPCRGAVVSGALTEEDGVAIRLAYTCTDAPPAFTIRLALLGSLSLGHRHLAAIVADGSDGTNVLSESSPELRIVAIPGAAEGVAWPLFRLGIQHILTGYDHLLFLFGLILVGGRVRPLLLVVTAFTLAHSITLGLAAAGVWAPNPRLVEPAIALSIAYVGIENFFVRDAGRRWLVTFPFGLVHGFGFAGALREIALPPGQIPVALASFNVGVEAGQLAVLAVILPGVLWLGRREWFAPAGTRVASFAIALAGLYWFAVRVA
jgi:hydrogenase/urease accessory protein HupE